MHIDLSGFNELAADLADAGIRAVPLASAAIKKTAHDIEREAKAFCPVDTGNLRNSISTSAYGIAAEIGPTAEYGVYVEEGTSRMAPQAFMGPAFDRQSPALVTALESIAGRLI